MRGPEKAAALSAIRNDSLAVPWSIRAVQLTRVLEDALCTLRPLFACAKPWKLVAIAAGRPSIVDFKLIPRSLSL